MFIKTYKASSLNSKKTFKTRVAVKSNILLPSTLVNGVSTLSMRTTTLRAPPLITTLSSAACLTIAIKVHEVLLTP